MERYRMEIESTGHEYKIIQDDNGKYQVINDNFRTG